MTKFATPDTAALSAVAPAELTRLKRGIEKESLRVTTTGQLSAKPHPKALGSALTHPLITTDFSEAQLELITAPHEDGQACIDSLKNTHRFVYENLGDELLWTTSMPCILGEDGDIPVGQYGTSNIAQAKTVYRLGLGNRYGRLMQTISGIHYNFSLADGIWPALAASRGETNDQDFVTRAYFDLIRNFRRHSWLLIYLFGASPAVCKSFVRGNPNHGLKSLDEGSLYLPDATSLRMGGLGYQSNAQASLHISYNDLHDYAASMEKALTRPYPDYEALGVQDARGYKQLNTALLQIENEFYGTIRPKRPINSGERPITALRGRGVEYVEVRCLDVNPFLPVGIDCAQMHFLDTFLMYCVLSESPHDSEAESVHLKNNQQAIVERGRSSGLELTTPTGERLSRDTWATEILDGCAQIADRLDDAHGNDKHSNAVEQQRLRLADPELTPSARILETMFSQKMPFFRFAMNQSIAHKGYFTEHALRAEDRNRYHQLSKDSLEQQQAIEAADTVDFETFLAGYLSLQ